MFPDPTQATLIPDSFSQELGEVFRVSPELPSYG
jgi:hypothetical protein